MYSCLQESKLDIIEKLTTIESHILKIEVQQYQQYQYPQYAQIYKQQAYQQEPQNYKQQAYQQELFQDPFMDENDSPNLLSDLGLVDQEVVTPTENLSNINLFEVTSASCSRKKLQCKPGQTGLYTRRNEIIKC